MRELITYQQANQLMLVVFGASIVIGLIWGVASKRIGHGLFAGAAVGTGNLILWRVYNIITNNLGLDTVKNLLVNLALFIAVGVIAGLAWGKWVQPGAGSE